MELILIILSGLLVLLSVLPFIQHPHWVFRMPEFAKLQLLVLQIIAFSAMFLYVGDGNRWLWALQAAQAVLIVYHAYILMRYTKFWRKQKHVRTGQASEPVKIISCNIYQFNTEFDRFISLVHQEQPDIVLAMESNAEWERAMQILEEDYPYTKKVALENTYGMHLYSKLKMTDVQTHYFVADDVPSIEATIETNDGHRFIFFGVHPPPPSPTEEENAKERDGDLLSVAKKVRKARLPVLVTGDFNNVAWAKSSLLFKKTSELIDARIGRGILATFHAKYWFFRVPLDLLFHSPDIFIDHLTIYPSIGSDHFPMGCVFHIDRRLDAQEDEVKQLEEGEMEEVNEMIREGKEEESNNRNADADHS